eukprot:120212_1
MLFIIVHVYILLCTILLSSTIAQQNKNCSHLQGAFNSFNDGDTVILSNKCIINTTVIINLNNIHLTIDGENNQIDFTTDQEHLFEITNTSTLRIENIKILSPFKHTSNQKDIKSIFYLSNNSSLILNSVQFINNIDNNTDYLYTKYIIYSPKNSNSMSSSVHITNSIFNSNFAIKNDAVHVIGNKNINKCPQNNPCCQSQIYITNTIYNQISQAFVTAFCSEISITNTNITNNIVENHKCILCIGHDTKTTLHNIILDNNDGTIVNMISNHTNTGYHIINISNIYAINCNFNSNGFLQLYPNI